MSIWFAHVDLEDIIRLAKEPGHVYAMVTLDIANAHDSAERLVLINKIVAKKFPRYSIFWIQEF